MKPSIMVIADVSQARNTSYVVSNFMHAIKKPFITTNVVFKL